MSRIATWADIRRGAVVRKPPGYEYTITAVGQTMALRMRHGREYALHRESVEEGLHEMVEEAPESDAARYRAALENIKRHIETALPTGYRMSSVWHIIDKALESPDVT